GHLRKQLRHIRIVHPKAAMADAHTDAERLVGAMNDVAAHGQVHLERSHGIVRSRRHHCGQRVASGGMFRADRLRWVPGWIGLLARNARLTYGGGPAFPADTHRPGTDPAAISRVMVETVFR